MRSAAQPRGCRAPQLHAVAPASVTRALPVCAARPRSAQRDTRFHAALAVRGCCTARNAARRFSWLTPSWLTSPLGQGRTRKARVATALQPAPRGGALVASAGEVGEARRGLVYKDAFFNRAAELKSLATLLAGPPRAVLVLTGPPSCGKSGARAPWFCHFRLGLTLCALQRCSSNWWPAARSLRVRPSSTAALAVRAAPVRV
jgi:hypothetical protein